MADKFYLTLWSLPERKFLLDVLLRQDPGVDRDRCLDHLLNAEATTCSTIEEYEQGILTETDLSPYIERPHRWD